MPKPKKTTEDKWSRKRHIFPFKVLTWIVCCFALYCCILVLYCMGQAETDLLAVIVTKKKYKTKRVHTFTRKHASWTLHVEEVFLEIQIHNLNRRNGTHFGDDNVHLLQKMRLPTIYQWNACNWSLQIHDFQYKLVYGYHIWRI